MNVTLVVVMAGSFFGSIALVVGLPLLVRAIRRRRS